MEHGLGLIGLGFKWSVPFGAMLNVFNSLFLILVTLSSHNNYYLVNLVEVTVVKNNSRLFKFNVSSFQMMEGENLYFKKNSQCINLFKVKYLCFFN